MIGKTKGQTAMWVLVVLMVINNGTSQPANGQTTYVNGFSTQATCEAAALAIKANNSGNNHLLTQTACISVS
jgi:hypothetical protein